MFQIQFSDFLDIKLSLHTRKEYSSYEENKSKVAVSQFHHFHVTNEINYLVKLRRSVVLLSLLMFISIALHTHDMDVNFAHMYI